MFLESRVGGVGKRRQDGVSFMDAGFWEEEKKKKKKEEEEERRVAEEYGTHH